MFEKLKSTIDDYPWVLMVAPIIIVAVIAYFLLAGKMQPPSTPQANVVTVTNTSRNTPPQQSNATNQQQSQGFGSNIFSFLLRLLGLSATSATQNATNSVQTSGNNTQTTNSGNAAGQSNNTANPTGSQQSSNQNSSATTNSNSNNSGNSTTSNSGNNSTNGVPIIFKTPDGGTQEYFPPATPPIDISWGRYVNSDDRFSIDYPSNWQVVKTSYNGHEGVSLYPPGSNPNAPNAQYIGFGLASYYLLPSQNSQQSTYSYSIVVGTTNGTMYTQGVLGNGSVAAVFKYEQGSFGLGSNVSDPDFIYVYNYMLQSLTFGPQ